MSAQVPEISTSTSSVGRQPVDYHPGFWTNEFLTCPDFKENDQDSAKLFELKQDIERMLMADVTKPSQKLDLIDVIQRLGISYHFENKIDEILEKVQKDIKHEYDLKDDHDDLYSTSLRFRLLRQHGYRISTEVFNKFKGIDGNFKESLTMDVKGLLSMYEASHLRVHKEDILDEALDFTTKHLESMPTQIGIINTSFAKQIVHALERPLRKGVPRIEARFYIQVYQEDPRHNEVILRFAKMDFNMLQKLHQKELSDIIRWWKSLNLPQKLPFARDRVVEAYFWMLGFYFEPRYLLGRKILTKVLLVVSIIDDIYDVYGTIEELQHFTKVIERLDNDTDLLPEYMKYCYETLLDFWNEIEKDIAFGNNAYRLHYAKENMKNLVRSYLIETTWCNQQYVPTIEEYMEVALVTGGLEWLVPASFLGMEEIVTKEAFEWFLSRPKIDKATSLIGRLMNDMAGHKFEQKRKHVASAMECYMKQHGVSEEETKNIFLKEIESAWKDINEECLRPTTIPMPLLERALNFARTMDFLYKKDDLYTHSYLNKGHIASLLKDPIELSKEEQLI